MPPGFLGEAEEACWLSWRLAKANRPDASAVGVVQLERRQDEARLRDECLLEEQVEACRRLCQEGENC